MKATATEGRLGEPLSWLQPKQTVPQPCCPPSLPQVDGDIPPRVKKDAHELILDFIRSRPPLKQVPALRGVWKVGSGTLPARARRASRELAPNVVLPHPLQVSERRLRPLPQKQRTLHEKILEEIKQERRLRPVESRRWDGRGERGEHGTPLPCASSPPTLSCPSCLTSCLPQGSALCPASSTPALGTSNPLPVSTCPSRMLGAAPSARGPGSCSRHLRWLRWKR